MTSAPPESTPSSVQTKRDVKSKKDSEVEMQVKDHADSYHVSYKINLHVRHPLNGFFTQVVYTSHAADQTISFSCNYRWWNDTRNIWEIRCMKGGGYGSQEWGPMKPIGGLAYPRPLVYICGQTNFMECHKKEQSWKMPQACPRMLRQGWS